MCTNLIPAILKVWGDIIPLWENTFGLCKSLEGEHLEEIDTFTYLGSAVDMPRVTDNDVKIRIGKVREQTSNSWEKYGGTDKVRIFNSSVKSVLLYGAETWRTNSVAVKKIQTFVNMCL